MRIALFTDTYPPEVNGVATSVHTLATALKEHGHDVLIVTTNPFSKKITYEDGILRLPGIELKSMYGYIMTNIYNSRAYHYVREFNPDLIHNQTDFGVGIFSRTCVKKLDVPMVYTYHTMMEDYAYYVTKGKFDRAARSFLRTYTKNGILHSDAFITPSDKTKDYMRRIGVDKYAYVIPTGVDFKKFFPENIDPEITKSLKEKYGISPNKFTLLSLGRVAKEKSIEVTLEGYKHFRQKYPEIESQMVIVGDGPNLDDLKNYSKELGIAEHVIFTGSCNPNEVQNFYSLGDSFCSASLSETQGLTYMEAMAAHKYVLARYDHNLIDVITDGETGFFFENKDEFADKLKLTYEMWKKKDKKMLDKAIASIDNYSIETFYNNVMGVYKRVLKKYW